MAQTLDKDLRDFFGELDIVYVKLTGPVTKEIIRNSAQKLADATRANINDADRVVHRYDGRGKKVASYYPGNLRRSVQVLDHIKSRAVFVGYKIPPRSKGKGVFRGDRVDGWYATIVELRQAPLRRALTQTQSSMMAQIKAEISAYLNRIS